MTNKETLEVAAFESSVDYKPFEDNLSPKKYYQYGFIKGAEWQSEKMYSEEEVIEILLNFRGENPRYIEEWFEQFKKR